MSRVLGLVRDSVTAALLGGSIVNDALLYAWTLPNVFRRLFGEGALSAAFIPEFTRTLERDGLSRARIVANDLISTLGLFLIVLASLMMVVVAVVPDAALTAAFDLSLDEAAMTRTFLVRLLPYLAVICVIAQFMGVLHALGEFAVPAASPIILNVVWIAGALLAPVWAPDQPVEQGGIIVWAILVAAVLQFLWHLPRMAALGAGFALRRPRFTRELRSVLLLLGPMLLAMGAAQINILADRTIALAYVPEGGVTHLYLSLRVMQFPLGLVAIALGTAVFPTLARLVTRGEERAAGEIADLALRTNVLISLSAAVGLVIIPVPIVAVLFQGGQFDAESARRTAGALAAYGAGVPFLGTVLLLNRVCFALGNTRLPLMVGGLVVVVNVVLDLVLVGPLGEVGLALATTISAVVHALVLGRLLGPRLGRPSLSQSLKRVIPALLVAGVVALGLLLVDPWLAARVEPSRWGQGLRVAGDMAVALALFAWWAPRWCRTEWQALRSIGRGA